MRLMVTSNQAHLRTKSPTSNPSTKTISGFIKSLSCQIPRQKASGCEMPYLRVVYAASSLMRSHSCQVAFLFSLSMRPSIVVFWFIHSPACANKRVKPIPPSSTRIFLIIVAVELRTSRVKKERRARVYARSSTASSDSAVRNGCKSDGKQKCAGAAVANANDRVLFPFPECGAAVPLSIHLVFEDRGNSVQP